MSEKDKRDKLILRLYDILMISPLGYHRRGAAHEAFCELMTNQDVVNGCYERENPVGSGHESNNR